MESLMAIVSSSQEKKHSKDSLWEEKNTKVKRLV